MWTTLFNISLDELMKECNLKVFIINRATEMITYTDSLAVIGRDRKSIK